MKTSFLFPKKIGGSRKKLHKKPLPNFSIKINKAKSHPKQNLLVNPILKSFSKADLKMCSKTTLVLVLLYQRTPHRGPPSLFPLKKRPAKKVVVLQKSSFRHAPSVRSKKNPNTRPAKIRPRSLFSKFFVPKKGAPKSLCAGPLPGVPPSPGFGFRGS